MSLELDCPVTLDHPALQVHMSKFISAIGIYELTGFSPASHADLMPVLFLLRLVTA